MFEAKHHVSYVTRHVSRVTFHAIVGLFLLLLAACNNEEVAPTRPPKFSTRARVEIVSDTPSLSMYTDCSSRTARLAGMANDGDGATVLDRKHCADGWWYQVQITALRDTDWAGIGWVQEQNLKTR